MRVVRYCTQRPAPLSLSLRTQSTTTTRTTTNGTEIYYISRHHASVSQHTIDVPARVHHGGDDAVSVRNDFELLREILYAVF